MAITSFATPSADGTSAPLGSKLYVGGYISTGSYSTTIPSGDYVFVSNAGSSISCNGTTYSGKGNTLYGNDQYALATGNTGTFITAGSQTVTINTGALFVSSRLADRAGNNTWNRNAVRWNGSVYAFPDSSEAAVWKSTDGLAWSRNATTFTIGQCFMEANGVFFAGDVQNNNWLYTSTNGSTWTQRQMPTGTMTDGRLCGVWYVGGRYVAIFRRSSSNSYQVHSFYSTDLTTWTYGANISNSVSFGGNSDAYPVIGASSGTTLVLWGDGVGYNPYYCYTSNGASWTVGQAISQVWGADYYLSGAEYLNGAFIFYASYYSQGSALIVTSTTGTSFGATSVGLGTVNSNTRPSGISWNGTHYVITTGYANQSTPNNLAYSANYNYGYSVVANTGNVGGYYASEYFISGSQYLNGKWFLKTTAPGGAKGLYVGSTSNSNYTTIFGPGAFSLYRMYDWDKTLN